MNQFLLAIAIPFTLGLIVNEVCDIAPWLASRIARRAARISGPHNHHLAPGYEEEWARLIADCPGKLTKLLISCQFLAGALSKTGATHLASTYSSSRSRAICAAQRLTEFISNGPSTLTLGISVTLVLTGSSWLISRSPNGIVGFIVFLVGICAVMAWSARRELKEDELARVELIDAASLACGTTFEPALREIAREHGIEMSPFELSFFRRKNELGTPWSVHVDLPIPNEYIELRAIYGTLILLRLRLRTSAEALQIWDVENHRFVPASQVPLLKDRTLWWAPPPALSNGHTVESSRVRRE